MSDRECILHFEDCSISDDTDVKAFDDKTWLNVCKADQARRTLYKTSKFFRITLSKNYDSKMGYHTKCYKDYTAVSQPKPQVPSSLEKPVLRSSISDTTTPSSSSTGIFPKECLFCGYITKSKRNKRESLGNCETEKAGESIVNAARILNDQIMLARLSGINMISKEAKYHHSCRKEYLNKAAASMSKGEPSEKVMFHNKAFEMLKVHINTNLIENLGAELLTTLHKIYTDEIGESTYPASRLCEKILKEYPESLKFTKRSNKEGVVIFNASLSEEEAVRRARFDVMSLKESAFYLRGLILKSMHEQVDLPQPITLESIKAGQGETPPELLDFFRVLFTGSNPKTTSERVERFVKSVSDDVVFATTRGRTKPSKHMCMGLGLKSLTGSRQVIEIVNRFCHSVNYSLVESMETDLATNISERKSATPDGISKSKGLCTAVAWDNYDENIETLSGSDTIHDTVGICYQNIDNEEINQVLSSNQSLSSTSSCPFPSTSDQSLLSACTKPDETLSVAFTIGTKRTKRKLEVSETLLTPYTKKPKLTSFTFPVKTVPRPKHLTLVENRDILWVMCMSLAETPMWTGWNSKITSDPLPKQVISYMDNLSLPPTRLDVIAETLRISQRVANECGEQYAIVHYDLAVAKPAMQIQATDTPLYDNVFICFGPFHIELAYFGALGYFIDGSGGPEILTDTDILAPGSLNGFILGKHYNRCKRLHILLATAFQILHFMEFVDKTNPLPEHLLSLIQQACGNPTEQLIEMIETHNDYKMLMKAYNSYTENTLHGEHGATAMFWMVYIQLVGLFLKFSRAYRTNDIDLFTFALAEMCPIFFAGNRPNYSRWMVKYTLNLMNMDSTHPGIRPILEQGAFSVRRGNKTFSQTPVDMTLEQTVNADAASRKTGIASFGGSESARRRWMVTRSARSAVVGYLLESSGLKTKEDISKSLKPYRIKRDNEDLKTLIESIQTNMNPFSNEVADDNLYCLNTGVKVPDRVKDDMLHYVEKGKTWHQDFKSGCFEDASRFEKPIPRRKLKNFASTAVKSKLNTKDMKILELQGTRDLFGRLLYLSAAENIDLEMVFAYPLTSVPLSIAHPDGSMAKTDKSKLLQKLEKMIVSEPPVSCDTTIVDAMFFLHTISPPQTYGAVAEYVLQRLCNMSERVDFVCDVYKDPSIKDAERGRRGADDSVIIITGADQKRPRDWQNALRSSSFKMELFKFFAREWSNTSYERIIRGHQVFIGLEETCYSFTVKDGRVIREEVPDLMCQHEEADTRMAFHLTKIVETNPNANIAVRSNDTDVLVILAYHVHHLREKPHVWMDVGISSNNTRRHINITQLVTQINTSLIDALPGLHAFTGSDFSSAFMNKGKVRPLQLCENSDDHRHALGTLGDAIDVSEELLLQLEKFVCALYGKPSMSSVNSLRFLLFQQQYAPKNKAEPLDRIKGANPSSLPRSQRVLRNKILRANYISFVWKNAFLPNPYILQPNGNGWTLLDGRYHINWFDGPQVPTSITCVLENRELQSVEDEDEEVAYGEELFGPDESDDDDTDDDG